MKFSQNFIKQEYIAFILLIIINIYVLVFYIEYSSVNILKKIFIINTITLIIYFIYCVFLEVEIDNYKINIFKLNLQKGAYILSLIALNSELYNFFCASSLIQNYTNYKIYCPFVYSNKNIDYNLHINKRCELYNINKNQLYPYKYICSFNPSKDNIIMNPTLFFLIIYEKNIKCSKVQIINKENKVISDFIDEYSDEDLYFCDLVFLPPEYPHVNYKNCNSYNNLDIGIFLIVNFYLNAVFAKNLFSYFRFITANVNLEEIQ